MRANVRLLLSDGRSEVLGPGDIIGRMWSATLRLDDPHVSEAHALVSLRGQALKLLALRGRFLVNGQPLTEVDLAEGQRLSLSPETELLVAEVALPQWVLGLEAKGLPRQALSATCSLVAWPHPRLVPGAQANADAVLWSTGEAWMVRPRGEASEPLVPEQRVQIGGLELLPVRIPLAHAGQAHTRHGVDSPLHIIARFDTVHIQRAGSAPLVLSGLHARLISELIAIGGPVSWEGLAAELWADDVEREQLRRRWDVNLVRLRHRLRDAGVRPDLVQSSRLGLVELVLHPLDTVEDCS